MNAAGLNMRKIVITLEDREDGGLHVYSRDVRGLHLSGAEPQRVWANIGPAVAHQLRVNEGCRVRKVYYPSASPNGDSPRDVDLHVEHEVEFVVELEAA